MRRSLAFVSLLALSFLAQTALADVIREREPGHRAEGRAVILHPAKALSDADVSELAEEGVTVKHALTGGRYLARIKDTAEIAGDARIVSIEELTAEKKIHPTARREAAKAKPFAEVNVVFQRDVDFDDALQAIVAAGGATDPFRFKFSPSHRIEAKIPPASLEALASDDRVLTITGPHRFKIATENATSAAVSHVTEVQAGPYNLSGDGVTVSLFELGEAQTTHVEFGGRLTLAPGTSGGTSSDRRHATHVSGTIGAAGVRPDAKGMAPKVQIKEFCVRVSGANTCTGDWLDLKEEALAPLGIVADNNSWGYVLGWEDGDPPVWDDADIYWGAYDLTVGAPLDEISAEKGVLFVHSAGNDGNLPFSFNSDGFKSHYHLNDDGDADTTKVFCVSGNHSGTDCPTSCTGGCELDIHHPATPFDTMGVTAAAKNVIAVGAVDTNLNITSFSSRGPAKDGRVKPDVVARGQGVLSSVPTNAYGSLNGTSMSSPAVTGISALLVEQWRRTFAGANPKPSQLKALLIAGADDLGNPGPDYTFGFGLADAKNSVDLIIADEAKGNRIRDLTFAQGQQQSYEIPLIVSTPGKVRVVLHWPDPAIAYLGGDDIAAKALVNDLDLKLVDGAGTVYLPYVLDKNNFSANATTGVNTIDNTEEVEIANAPAGAYRAIVTGTTVNEGPQSAVLVSNIRAAKTCIDVQEASNNNTAATAYGNLPSGQIVYGGLCSQGDVDFYKFNVTRTGPISVTVKTGDTALRATLTGTGISKTQDIAANSTVTITATASTVPNLVTLEIAPQGALGAEPQYSFTPTFGQKVQPRRRTVRR